MSEQTTQKQRYKVSANTPEGAGDTVIFTFVPKGLEHGQGSSGVPKRVPQFVVAARRTDGGWTFDWSGTSDDPGPARNEMESEVQIRMEERDAWIDRVASLVKQVESWAMEMGWSTRRVEKQLDDMRIGKHRVPALLMQEATCRALLEPIGRSSAGAEGVVDLYLMPAYDDIVSLYYYGGQWNVHHNKYRGTNAVAPAPDGVALSKESLEKVLTEMRRNAA